MTAAIELNTQRLVTFTDAKSKQTFTYLLRRLTPADWLRFWAGTQLEVERDGNESVRRFDTRAAGIDLVERAVERVEGYTLREGHLCDQPGWQQKLPPGHKAHVAAQLCGVTLGDRVADAGEYFFDPESEDVYLDAVWGTPTAGMQKLQGLIHRFARPSAEHQRRYNRAASESRIVGGSRTGMTIYAGQQKLLVEIYDQLIQSVDGYTLNGSPLQTPEDIRAQMDAFHKVAAVLQLFAEPEDAASTAVAEVLQSTEEAA